MVCGARPRRRANGAAVSTSLAKTWTLGFIDFAAEAMPLLGTTG